MNIALVAKDSRLSVAVRSRINEGILDFFSGVLRWTT